MLWVDPDWRAEVAAWIGAELASRGRRISGPLEDVRLKPWAAVLRVSTAEGDLYFKANTDSLAQEASVVALLAARRPDLIAAPVAFDAGRGWMLLADAGEQLRAVIARERDLGRWFQILPLYASLQLDVAADADELVARGAPDLRLAVLPRRFRQLLEQLDGLPTHERERLEASLPWIANACAELASYNIPETIQHDDLTDGHIYLTEGRYLFLDWGDACVSHPFFTLAVTLTGVIAWGLDDVQDSVDITPFRDAYLAPYARATRRRDLADAADLALRLGWICRAVNGHLGGSGLEDTRTRQRMFLDGRP